jgi:hypothetical protein
MIHNQFVSALISSGADAYSNMYDVSIHFPWEEAGVLVTPRAEGFDIPDMAVEVDKREYHGTYIEVPKPLQTFDRKFTITYRLDASYNLYGNHMTWLSAAIDVVTGGVSNWAAVLGAVQVRALTGAYVATGIPATNGSIESDDRNANWRFDYCYVAKVTQPKFKTAGAEALTYAVDYIFWDINHAPFMNARGLFSN